ncbi:diphthine synthase [Candidatus Pacearchaeota archaeon CG10_big_fil_rev_8_21_14_0_10_34_12]|nr:MAG: diphthine synthase [Candidatus Pacearchaeota archaeon CG10_big_fil_rev_8_21_14_0_10_34_12]
MLYIVGLGLNEKGISLEGMEVVKKCKKVYLENYTVEFPYSKENLESTINKKVILSDRGFVESFEVLEEARKMDVALIIYGSPLMATTHISLMQEAKESKIKVKVIHSASVLDAVSETGLQLYKFGKITSIPGFEADSFVETIRENQTIGAHSLILIDIGLDFEKAIEKLDNAAKKGNIKFGKFVVCSNLGSKKQRIRYGRIEILKEEDIKPPFCFIIPGKLHFVEKDFLEGFWT